MGKATEYVRNLQEQARKAGGELEGIEVSQDMFEALQQESAPQTPSEALGVPVTVLAVPASQLN